MKQVHQIEINTRDRVLRAWENSMELVRDFENDSKEISDNKKVAEIFAAYAHEEAEHAAAFREILHDFQEGNNN